MQRSIRLMAPLMLLGVLSRIGVAAPAPDTPASPVGEKVGKITALLPTAHVIRGEGKKTVSSDAVKGEELVWQDLVRTDKGGRARITLNDQSILSLGSQAELRIVKHDARAQQTTLEMTYGRIRAQVSTVTRDGGSFQIHTPTAVAGVIGTDFGTDASEPGITTFICMSGVVQIGNADPSVPGTVPCTAGQTTTVKSGLPPTPPKPATQQQINQVITDTEPASVSAFAPASALIGTTVDAVATGTHMAGLNGVTISGSGVQVSLGANGTESSATAHLVISTSAQPGPRTVTFTKSNGANTAAIFTVIAPPGLQGTDAASLKKRYVDILTTEQQAADASNASVKASLQQESDQGLQTIQQNNAKLPQPLPTNQLSQQLAGVVANFNAAGSNRETQAVNNANAAVDQIVAAIESKIQDGSEPAANIAADLDKQFAPVNQAFQAALNQVHADLVTLAASSIQSIDQQIANFEQGIALALQQQSPPPTPKVDANDRSAELGSATSFDAGGSTALSGASIVSTTWTLCDPSYRPAQVGVVLPANAPACKTVPGFAASSGQFQFNTCGLAPADYIARLTVVDSNGKSSGMDVRLHVTPPGYDDPPTRLQNLAAAYMSLQSQQFLSFFDPTAYSGYTQLQENIRDTFLNLSSMQINVRVSQSNLNCNDATIRADWDQNYTFKNDQTCVNAQAGTCQKQLFTQHEQLTARMTRRPGSGWYIVDFQGDNGKVQGAAPGPQTTFAPPSAGSVDLAVGTVAPENSLIGTQTATLDVLIANVGTAPSTASTGNLKLTSPDFPGVLGTADIPLIPAAGNVTIHLPFTVPNVPGSHPIKVAIDPASPGDSNAGNDSTPAGTTLTFVAAVDLAVTTVSAEGTLIGTQTGILDVTIANSGNLASTATTGNLKLTSPDFPDLQATADIPTIPAKGTATIHLPFTVPNVAGVHSIKVAITPASPNDINAGNDFATPSLSLVAGVVDLKVGTLSFTSGTPPLASGGNYTVSFTVTNLGNVASAAGDTVSCSLTDGNASASLGTTANIGVVAANATSGSLGVSFGTPVSTNFTGNTKVVCTATKDPLQDATKVGDNTNSIPAQIILTDFNLTNTLNLNGDLNVKLGGQGLFNVSLTEPQGITPFSVPVAAGPAVPGVTYVVASPFAAGSTNQVVVLANGSAPAGTSTTVGVTGTLNGISHSATQSIRFYTASLENFSAGQPGSNQAQPIILPINGAAQPLSIRLSGNFFNPGGGAQLTFPTVTGLSITPSATTAAAGDVITLQISAVQGAAVNQTIPLGILAHIPNMNPPVPETLIVFVRPTALPDLAVTSVSVTGRNFNANPLLSGEPVDVVVAVANKGAGASQGFERLHVLLNGVELTNSGVTVPQSIAPGSSVNVFVHVVAPDPVANGAATLTAKVDEDPVGDLDPANDSLGIAITTSDWTLGTNSGSNGGNSDANALIVPAGASNATFIQPEILGSGDFFTPITVLNGIVSSRIAATPSLASLTSTRQQIGYTINASGTAAQGFYAAQLIARFVDGGRPTAQRQATVHIQVSNASSQGDTVTVTSTRNNACANGCPAVQINGLLNENVGLTPTRSAGSTGSVDLHFTDPSAVISNVTTSGSFQSPILHGVPYGVAANVFFAAAQDATGAVSPGPAQVTVSATSIQTSAMRGAPTPQPVGPNQTTLQFNVGDLQLTSQPCFNLAPGAEGVLQLTFTPLGGFNVPSISWSLASLPPGVVLNSLTSASNFSGGSYSPVSIDLTNTNPTDITTTQSLTLLGSISNNNGSATVAFAPAIQLHSGSCTPGAVRNAMIEGGGLSGTRGVWKRGSGAGAIARANIARPTPASSGDPRLIAGDVSYTPSMPKAGDTVQVRFRITNPGSSEARDVPVSLVVNGAVVASDTFDIGAGKTVLGGLQWTNAQLPRTAIANSAIVANLVVDPGHNARATVASGKVAPLAHFSISGAVNAGGAPIAPALGGRQRALIQMAESACAGFRFSSGASAACGSSDVEIAFEDAASGRFSLASSRGIFDLGMAYNGNGVPANAQYSGQAAVMAGHSYAVQLDGGRVGVLTIRSINNPRQKSATAEKVFRGGASRRIARKLGKTNEPVETGDVSGAAAQNTVATLELLYDNP